ncbi:hypothetical protein A9Z61_09580 [Moraxella osloensis]|nr:hypothetical protein [Moraxella osloensis]OBX55092.1 hypothetical protein A9Z61_09580 [Moraxella osloensis]
MPNLASSPHHTLLSLTGLALTGLALTGFLALTYLAFHQPTSVLAANASKATSETTIIHHQSHHPLSHPNSHQNHYQNQQHQQPKHHNHQADGESASSPSQNAIFKSKRPAKSPVSSQQNSRLVDALLVMGGLGCH